MRVIAGSRRSLPLKTVKSDAVRPTTDRIKETLFNMLQPYLPGAVFIDLFAGSGGIGIEALSRGAKKAFFIDRSREAVKVIRENLAFTKLEAEAEVFETDAFSGLTRVGKACPEGADILFMDPPYGEGLEKRVLEALTALPLLKPSALIIFDASADTDTEYAAGLGYEIVKIKSYGSNMHVWLKRSSL